MLLFQKDSSRQKFITFIVFPKGVQVKWPVFSFDINTLLLMLKNL